MLAAAHFLQAAFSVDATRCTRHNPPAFSSTAGARMPMMTGTMMTGAKSPGCWRSASALVTLLAALAAALSAMAQTPVNPLRSVLAEGNDQRLEVIRQQVNDPSRGCRSGPTEADYWVESLDPTSQIVESAYQAATATIAAGDAEPLPEPFPGPPSVVPPSFNQPTTGNPWPGDLTHQAPPGAIGPHDSFVQPWFTHTDPNDPFRHQGVGRPLIGTSWLNRPVYVGIFLGGLLADDLISGHVESNNSFFFGGRLGWDFDHYWGLEGRYAFSRPQINDGDGNTLRDPSRDYFIDVSLAYYPWGDSQWRPFISGGLGLQTFRFHDDQDERVHQSLLSMPIGVGIKYYHSPFHTLRLEAYDNIAFGDGRLKTMQNFTIAAGVEFRFGGRPVSYFPWHGSTSYR
jgi:hypothetical protein